MSTATTGNARTHKVGPAKQKCKSDYSDQLSREAVHAILVEDARQRQAAKEHWRNYLTYAGRTLENLAMACWLLTSGHGEVPRDRQGKALGIHTGSGEYQAGISQLAALAGVSRRTMQAEVAAYFQEFDPGWAEDPDAPLALLSAGRVEERRQTLLRVSWVEGFDCEILASDCAEFSQLRNFRALMYQSSRRGEGTVSFPSQVPNLPPTPQEGEVGGRAGEDSKFSPDRELEKAERNVQVQEALPLTPVQEALAEAMTETLGVGRRLLVEEAVRKCPPGLLRAYREAWPAIWRKALGDAESKRVRSAPAVVLYRIGAGTCAEEVARWRAAEEGELHAVAPPVRQSAPPRSEKAPQRPEKAAQSLQELLASPSGYFAARMLLEALEDRLSLVGEEDSGEAGEEADERVARGLADAGPLTIRGQIITADGAKDLAALQVVAKDLAEALEESQVEVA